MPDHAARGSSKRFTLPFAILDANRHKEFTKNMEMAAILYLAESCREKGESHLLRKTDEKIVFLAEACYPLWLIPYNSANLVFDGLNLVSHTFYYDVTPDVEIFNKDIQRKQKTTEAYMAALTRNIEYFRNFKSKEKTEIEGLITTPDLKTALKNFFPYMKEAKKPATTGVVLTPTIENHEIRAGAKQLSELEKRINKDIEDMNASIKLLNIATVHRVKTIRDEIRKTQEQYHMQIKRIKHQSTRRIRQIQNQYNRKITRTSKRFKRKLLKLNKDQSKHKKTLRQLRTEAKRCEKRLNSTRHHIRKQAKAQRTLKLERTRKKLTAIGKEIKEDIKRIRRVENTQKHELSKQKNKCLKRIESTTKIFRDLQGSKEAEIMMKRQEIVTVEGHTRYITKSIQEMIQKKKIAQAEFDRIPLQHGKWTKRLVYVPFYLARYEKRETKRYSVYSPSVIGGMGLLTKMKGALGATKVNALLQPRSEAVTNFLKRLPELFEKKTMFEKNVTEEGIQNSILLRKRQRVDVKKGLKELENENWISKNELQAISKILYMYSSSMNRQTKTVLVSEDDYLKCPLA